jgi:Uma2 family endonuclease
MSTATETSPITLEEFLALSAAAPADQTLELIEGELRARPMTTRGPRHSQALIRAGHVMVDWLDQQKDLTGTVAGGEVRCRLAIDPETIVGIDIALWLGDEFVHPPVDPPLYDAPPVVAVEVLSPSDTHEGVTEKVQLFLKYGVRQVWIADPDLQTVTIHRPDREPEFFTASQTLTAEPELPGFQVAVRSLFQAKGRS